MRIQSSSFHQRFPKAPVDGFTASAKRDRDISSQNPDSVELGSSRFEASRSRVRSEFATKALGHGVFGTLAGLALGNFHPLAGALGAGLGAYVAWNQTLRADSGQVTIQHNGEQRTTKYYGKPSDYLETTGEKRTKMLINRAIGDEMPKAAPDLSKLSSSKLSGLDSEQRENLKSLGDQQKLVADLGQKSRYGYQVLTSVDARTAGALMTDGQDVYALGGSSKDTRHEFEFSAHNNRSTVRREQSDFVVERKFDYELTKLKADGEIPLPEGQGLPEGFNGVYKNLESCTLSMGRDLQSGEGATGKNFSRVENHASWESRDSSLGLGQEQRAGVKNTASINVRDLVMMVGIAAGGAAGLALAPGVPSATLAGFVIGGVAGRELGWLAQDRMPSFDR